MFPCPPIMICPAPAISPPSPASEGKSITIIDYNEEENEVRLHEDALKSVLEHGNAKNLPVAILSIAGAFRKGKSFLLSFCLRYLKYLGHEGEAKEVEDWLADVEAPLAGFHWRGGTRRETLGIQLWSEPFVIENDAGNKIAVLLMDTQGTFDNTSTMKESTFIFALSSLISSVQVYNLQVNIQEDQLQHLQVFSDYGRLASSTESKPFQKIIFLVRDWACPADYPYGSAGGKDYLNKEVMSHRGNESLQSVREHLRDCYQDLDCFLLPYPGKMVATSGKTNYDGNLAGIDDIFVEKLRELMEGLFTFDNLVVKNIGGVPVTGGQLVNHVKTYVEAFQGGEEGSLPEPKSIYEAISEANHMSALDQAVKKYEDDMDRVCGAGKWYLRPDAMEDLHEECLNKALEVYSAFRKIGTAFNQKYREQLERDIERKHGQFATINNSNWWWVDGVVTCAIVVGNTSDRLFAKMWTFLKDMYEKIKQIHGLNTYVRMAAQLIQGCATAARRFLPTAAPLFFAVESLAIIVQQGEGLYRQMAHQLPMAAAPPRIEIPLRPIRRAPTCQPNDDDDGVVIEELPPERELPTSNEQSTNRSTAVNVTSVSQSLSSVYLNENTPSDTTSRPSSVETTTTSSAANRSSAASSVSQSHRNENENLLPVTTTAMPPSACNGPTTTLSTSSVNLQNVAQDQTSRPSNSNGNSNREVAVEQANPSRPANSNGNSNRDVALEQANTSTPSNSIANTSGVEPPNSFMVALKETLKEFSVLQNDAEKMAQFRNEMKFKFPAILVNGMMELNHTSPECYKVVMSLSGLLIRAVAEGSPSAINQLLQEMPNAIRNHPSMKGESTEPLQNFLMVLPGAIEAIRNDLNDAVEKFQTHDDMQPLTDIIKKVVDMLTNYANYHIDAVFS